jgi:hypothetical protein
MVALFCMATRHLAFANSASPLVLACARAASANGGLITGADDEDCPCAVIAIHPDMATVAMTARPSRVRM